MELAEREEGWPEAGEVKEATEQEQEEEQALVDSSASLFGERVVRPTMRGEGLQAIQERVKVAMQVLAAVECLVAVAQKSGVAAKVLGLVPLERCLARLR